METGARPLRPLYTKSKILKIMQDFTVVLLSRRSFKICVSSFDQFLRILVFLSSQDCLEFEFVVIPPSMSMGS